MSKTLNLAAGLVATATLLFAGYASAAPAGAVLGGVSSTAAQAPIVHVRGGVRLDKLQQEEADARWRAQRNWERDASEQMLDRTWQQRL